MFLRGISLGSRFFFSSLSLVLSYSDYSRPTSSLTSTALLYLSRWSNQHIFIQRSVLSKRNSELILSNDTNPSDFRSLLRGTIR